MTELETMQRAKMYIDKLAKGINPLDNSVIPENDIINNVRLSRCLFYVSDVLRQVIENGGRVVVKNSKKEPFSITFNEIEKFQPSDMPIPVSKIAERINSLVNNANMKKLTYKNITDWLLSIEMLQISIKPDGKTTKMPTASGNELGITTEERIGTKGNYIVALYNRQAQQFIVDNIDSIIDMMNSKTSKSGNTIAKAE